MLFQPRPCCLERRAFGLGALVRLGRRAVRLAEGVAAGDQRDGLFVVHRHAAEGRADVLGGGHRVAAGVRAFRIHVDQAHVRRAQRLVQVTVAGEALVGVEPDGLVAPVDVVVGFPHVLAAAGETEGAEAHRLQRDVAGEDQQVGPGDASARTSA